MKVRNEAGKCTFKPEQTSYLDSYLHVFGSGKNFFDSPIRQMSKKKKKNRLKTTNK